MIFSGKVLNSFILFSLFHLFTTTFNFFWYCDIFFLLFWDLFYFFHFFLSSIAGTFSNFNLIFMLFDSPILFFLSFVFTLYLFCFFFPCFSFNITTTSFSPFSITLFLLIIKSSKPFTKLSISLLFFLQITFICNHHKQWKKKHFLFDN